MKRALPSVSDFADILSKNIKKNAKIPVYYGKFLASTASSVSNIMSSSKGRDKICALIQYTADLYYVCLENTNIPEIEEKFRNEEILSARVASKIEQSMSNGRKIFRFLKFLGEVKHVKKALNSNKPTWLKVMMSLSRTCSFFYYILDNILWAINIGILSEFFEKTFAKRWKKSKDSFSLFRNVFEFILNYFKLRNSKIKEKLYAQKLLAMKNTLVKLEDESYDALRNLLRKRRKRRFQMLEVFHSTLRLLMLVKSLRLPGESHLDPVFISFLGLVSTSISLFKAIQAKQKLIKIEEPVANPKPTLKYQRSVSNSMVTSIEEFTE